MQPFIVGVRFAQVGKAYHFDASALPQVKVGDHVIVETSRGRQLGEVTQIVNKPSPPPEGSWKPVERLATPRDLLLRRMWAQKELEAMIACRERAAQLKLSEIKIVAAEFSFDGSRLILMFTQKLKVDLKSLRHDMASSTAIPGGDAPGWPRDVAKMLGGSGLWYGKPLLFGFLTSSAIHKDGRSSRSSMR
jgi:cell fate regulator YaaT (PSP1 superfamily)